MSNYPLHSQDVNGRQMVVVPSEVKAVERGAQQAFAVLSRSEIAKRRSENEKAKAAAQRSPAVESAASPQSFAILSRAEIVRRRHESENAKPEVSTEIPASYEPPRRRGRPPKKR